MAGLNLFYRFKSKSGHSDSQLIVIGALVPAVPWVIHYADKPEDDCVKATIDIIKLTHPEESLIPYIEIYARLLHRVLNGKDLTEEVKNFISHKKKHITMLYVINLSFNSEWY